MAGRGDAPASDSTFSFSFAESPGESRPEGHRSAAAATVSQTDPDTRLDEEVARKLEAIYAMKLDWRSESKDFILSDDTVLPGQELLRFVPTEGSCRDHRHIFTYRNGRLSASLQGAEKGLR
jgi:hypothetical protein